MFIGLKRFERGRPARPRHRQCSPAFCGRALRGCVGHDDHVVVLQVRFLGSPPYTVEASGTHRLDDIIAPPLAFGLGPFDPLQHWITSQWYAGELQPDSTVAQLGLWQDDHLSVHFRNQSFLSVSGQEPPVYPVPRAQSHGANMDRGLGGHFPPVE